MRQQRGGGGGGGSSSSSSNGLLAYQADDSLGAPVVGGLDADPGHGAGDPEPARHLCCHALQVILAHRRRRHEPQAHRTAVNYFTASHRATTAAFTPAAEAVQQPGHVRHARRHALHLVRGSTGTSTACE
jgi:hypothetical protein